MTFSLGVSIVIFLLISIRQWLPEWIRIWQIMTAGAVILLVTGQIGPTSALDAIDWNVIAYLFGVFTISHALYDCGIAHRLSDWICKDRDSASLPLFLFLVLVALISAVLTNDAAAAIGTPIAITIAARLKIAPSVPLIALCAIVTVGSMTSPVGNPQNILIVADGHFSNPVGTFAAWLFVPTLLSLLFCFIWYRFCLSCAPSASGTTEVTLPAPSSDQLWPALLATGVLSVLVIADSVLAGYFPRFDIPLGAISVLSCLPVYIFSRERITIFKQVDWHTLIFFVAMFIVTGAVLQSGVLQNLLGSWQDRLNEPFIVAKVSFWASQLFSNVPVVEIYLNLLKSGETQTFMLLAGISTLAGNLFITSAASNVIVVQQAEKLGAKPFQFWQFTRLVIPVTFFSVAVCYGWVVYVYPVL
ncbi:YbiR family transporter [Roseibium hamelinense]|uniref:YbiR family transporter n=1 Tax=Roseibium hamelinense TaxID=150831 RepID=A0A562SNM6_9HYPH|nr:SLC13 family permease [Roseibium hamelinense]MTI44305.1 TRAP transporter large permease subunit [Roseibium hamelinense]TWI82919.1 YbiR family transporter [Roseibium hamelinense]